MAKRRSKLKRGEVARPDWARFCAGWHGKGAHSDQSKYTRKTKHRGQGDEQ